MAKNEDWLDAWSAFLAARARAIRSMMDAGHTPAQVREELNLQSDLQVHGIYDTTRPRRKRRG